MSWWNAKYKNDHGEYEITFASKYKERTKAVEKLCQAIIDKRVKSEDDFAVVVRCKDCKHYVDSPYNNEDMMCVNWERCIFPNADDFCSCGERKDDDQKKIC